MRIIRHWAGLAEADRGASVAIGNFDGVHLGHLSVLEQARKAGGRLGVLTFEPHPRQFFIPDAPPFRLMNAESRANQLKKLGVDLLYELPFDPALAEMSAETFANQVLGRQANTGLGIRHAVVGADFCYGKGRKGSVETLRQAAQSLGFGLSVAPILADEGAEISSTSIRRALAEGRPRDAARMLGHWHRIEGEVLHGEKRGRALGYPTANMSVGGLHLPKLGVYAVRVDVLTGPHRGSYHGAGSLGVRPMFGSNQPNLESHLFDFDGDLYGQHLSIALVEYLRPELKFDGLPALIAQMGQDCDTARKLLAAL